ncbi:MAG TPA: hypothetical protein VJP79_12675 [Nitrososphaera sp.]|nr:hypothetical protein [Nitrososphaera sp.]
MEIIESIMWVALGFVPTLTALSFASKREGGKLAPASRAGRLGEEVVEA